MLKQSLQKITMMFLLFSNCQISNSSDIKMMGTTTDNTKRDLLVKKYNLMNFGQLKQPIFMSIDEFFDGNNDEASIAPNLTKKLSILEYYKILRAISNHPKTTAAFVAIKDVMIYENGKLKDNEWFYTDIVYFIGDLTREEILEATKSLQPDEVAYESANSLNLIGSKYKDKKIVSVWWD